MTASSTTTRTDLAKIGGIRPYGGRAEQKKLGAFYTPASLSDVLVDWAVRQPSDSVLEPGFGGCGFIDSALRRLAGLGCPNPSERLFGCDIDDHAFDVLRTAMPPSAVAKQFVKMDFLSCKLGDTWKNRFSAIVGNPPYISFQSLGSDARSRAQRLMRESGFDAIPARASLWAYFVLHASSFLLEGGRAAWVLPGSLLQANYAKTVLRHLQRSFQRVQIMHIHERLFLKAGADEETVVLLTDDYRPAGTCGARTALTEIDSLADLRAAICQWDNTPCSPSERTRPSNDEPPLLKRKFPAANDPVMSRTVGETLRIKIGLVTGDNPFFVLSTAEAASRGLRVNDLQPILSKFSMISGATLTTRDIRRAAAEGARAWLVSAPTLPRHSSCLASYLLSYPADKLATVSTFRKRPTWHAIEDGRPPDAFWPVMRHEGPVLVLNNAKVNCTNTIHRAYLRPGATLEDLLVTLLGVASTYGQVSAELVGRHYGSGVLKHEPREVESIRTPWARDVDPSVLRSAVNAVDALLRKSDGNKARQQADEFFQQYDKNYSPGYIKGLEALLRDLRHRRVPPRRQSPIPSKSQPTSS